MGGCAPATGINSPQRGRPWPPARFACAVPAAPRALPGRGLHPQTPRAAPPGAPSRTGPLLPRSPSRRGFRHGCDGGGGGQPLAVVHARRLAPPLSPGFSFSKARQPERGQAAGLSTGGRQSLQRRRWADPGTACRAAVHLGWAAGLSTAKAGHRAERQRHPAPGSRRRRRSALCRFIRENDSCEFGKNPALARARARLLVFFS